MSNLHDGREVRCDGSEDGSECAARTRWPIGLHPLERAAPVALRPAAGWLCVTGNHQRPRHFCPLCAHAYLRSVSNDLPGARKK